MKKLIGMIPTGGKTLEDMIESVESAWPDIEKKLNLNKSKSGSLLSRLRWLVIKLRRY